MPSPRSDSTLDEGRLDSHEAEREPRARFVVLVAIFGILVVAGILLAVGLLA